MQKIYPYLWFDKNLGEIVAFYKSVFPDAAFETNAVLEHTPSGEVESGTLTILGQKLGVMAAGPLFKFTEAISLVVNCDTQEEIDYYWTKLSAVPEAEQCGWCKDKYGISWQIVPTSMERMMLEGTKEQIARVVAAFMPMKKLDVATLEVAYSQHNNSTAS
jgi:predicted 3-demethylubiquinone-9 3-methyltransferase (glyoxalase superfamily)